MFNHLVYDKDCLARMFIVSVCLCLRVEGEGEGEGEWGNAKPTSILWTGGTHCQNKFLKQALSYWEELFIGSVGVGKLMFQKW